MMLIKSKKNLQQFHFRFNMDGLWLLNLIYNPFQLTASNQHLLDRYDSS